MKCLLVDDEPGIRDALAALLRLRGHEVRTAGEREVALALLRDQSFDVVISDWRLPDGDAGPLLGASHAPVIVVSGHPDEVDAEPPPLAVLGKPVALPGLLALLQRLTDQAPAARDAALPSDVRAVIDRALSSLADPADAEVWCDGTFVVLRASLRDGVVAEQLSSLGGDLQVCAAERPFRIELRLCRDGRPDPSLPVVEPARGWPDVAEFAVDFADTMLPPDLFLDCLDRAALVQRQGRRVHFLNVPPALREQAAGCGRSHDMPKKEPVGPRLPVVLAELWSQR